MIHSDDDRKRIAWNKAPIDSAQDPSKQRNDIYGHPILLTEYGNRESQFGWYVSLIDPEEPLNFSSNLQAVNYRSVVSPK